MSSVCNEILNGGVFDVLISNQNEDFSKNILNFYKSSSFQQYSAAAAADIGVTVPFEGIPIGANGKYSEESFKEIQEKITNQEITSVSFNSQSQLISSTASDTIADAWLECIKQHTQLPDAFDNTPGLKARLSSPETNPTVVIFEFAWIPNSINDLAPKVLSLQISGASIAEGSDFGIDSEIPFGGGTLLLNRLSDDDAVTVALNTTKGDFSDTINSPDTQIDNLDIRIDGSRELNSGLRFEAISQGGNVNDYRWDFGDGNSASGKIVEHTYTQTGTVTVTVSASNSVDEAFSAASVQINFPQDFLLYGNVLFLKVRSVDKWLNGGRGTGNEGVHTRNELADPAKRAAYEWVIARTDSDVGSGSVKYGDTVYLQVRSVGKWLNGGRGTGNEGVHTRNELADPAKRAAYEWVIARTDSDVGSGSVKYGDTVYLQVRSVGKWLNGGRGTGNEGVHTRNELADPAKRAAYEWIIQKQPS